MFTPWHEEDARQTECKVTLQTLHFETGPLIYLFFIHCPLKTQWRVLKSHQASCNKNSVHAYDYYGNLQAAQKDGLWAVFWADQQMYNKIYIF